MLPDLQLRLISPDAEMCSAFEQRFDDLPRVTVIHGVLEDLDKFGAFATAGNSYGLMSAGIDAAVIERFGEQLQSEVQRHILDQYLGEQPVGTAFLVATGDRNAPWIIHAPSMRVPSCIEGRENIYLATWAVLLAVYHHELEPPINDLVMPAFGAGFGRVPFDEVARQMAVAYRYFLTPPYPPDWERVTARHRAISYSGTERRVQ